MPPTDYAALFNGFFVKRPRMTSVYKPLFLRSLLDAADVAKGKKAADGKWINARERDGRVRVGLDFVAVRMAKYSWDLHHGFRLRQSHAGCDSDLVTLIKDVPGYGMDGGKRPPRPEDLAGDKMGEFRAKVVRRCVRKQVLWRLRANIRGLYDVGGGGDARYADSIILGKGAAEFLHSHRAWLRNGLNHVLAGYLERINAMTPQIASKVDYDKHAAGVLYRPPLNPRIRSEMARWQDGLCFYCGRRLEDERGRPGHVDHVVPFAFVYSTHAYNCVMACRRCNCLKSDRLLAEDAFCRVLERNDDRAGRLAGKNAPPYERTSYERLFDACKNEYTRGREEFVPDDRGGDGKSARGDGKRAQLHV